MTGKASTTTTGGSGVRLGRFRIGEALARSGSAGVVVRAVMDPDDPRARDVALTLVDPSLVDADVAVRGWAIGARASHPALLTPLDFGVARGIPYVATQWVDGITLGTFAQVLHAGLGGEATASGRPSLRTIASLGSELADALASLGTSDAGEALVHGRLGPNRVMLGRTGQIRLMGIPTVPSALAGRTADDRRFVAPEQLVGDVPGPASDVYALGALLTWLWAGPHTEWAEARARLGREVPELAKVLEPALTVDPDGRHADPRWLAAHLDKLLGSMGGKLTDPEWRVLVEEVTEADAHEPQERAQARIVVDRILGLAPREEPLHPPANVPVRPSAAPGDDRGLFLAVAGAVAAGLLVSFSVHGWRIAQVEVREPTVAQHAAPTEVPAGVASIAPTVAAPPPVHAAPAPHAPTPATAREAARSTTPSPAPAPAPAAHAGGNGTISVHSNPRGVVYVDGQPIGTAPVDGLKVTPGAHTVEVRLGGHATASRKVDVRAGGAASVDVSLDREAAATGTLTVRANPPCVVYVDGQPVGTTPIEVPASAGAHVVELKLGGHRPERRDVTVRAGARATVDVQMVPEGT